MSLPSSYAPEDASESRTREECHIVIHPYEARDKARAEARDGETATLIKVKTLTLANVSS